MPSRLTLTLILCAALALAGCSGESKKQSGGTAGGEILPASVSDEMLPYDTVRSQAPLAPRAGGGEGGGNEDKNKDKAKNNKSAGKPDSETGSEASPLSD